MEWRSVPGYEGYYSVSDEGQVRSDFRYVKHRHGLKRINEIVLRQNTDVYGYKTVVLQRDGKAKTFKVHRLVMSTFVGDSDETVNHKDMNKANNTLVNLEYMTRVENSSHRRLKGPPFKMPRGKDHPNFKLSEEDWTEISRLIESGVKRSQIAALFKIHPATTYKAKYRLNG